MLPITARFPDAWKVTATIHRSGRDQWGDPLPDTAPRDVEDCLFAPTSSSEGTDLSEVPDDKAKLFAPAGTDIDSDDRISVPGFGTYWVDGTPKSWPLGVSVQLNRSQKKARSPDA